MSDQPASAEPQPPAESGAAVGPVPGAPEPPPVAPQQAPYQPGAYPQTPYQGAYPQTPYQGTYPQAPYQAAYPQGASVQPYPKNDLAVWSFVLGLAGLVLGCMLVTGIPAVIVGRNAQRAVAAGEANNGGLATAGIILGWVSIALTAVLVVLFGFLLVLGVALPFAITQSSSVG
ncbi:DUF4190 domain-containing protein [Cellulomonas soli]|uniref:DUF4190 domain-containing protein n=1 Tax=Cellulomonas soli TaxID=931535 RepID=UPI003F87251B